jgi:PHD/YefM family antitoxin component YafN of YafNO toxin-antitoxin module
MDSVAAGGGSDRISLPTASTRKKSIPAVTDPVSERSLGRMEAKPKLNGGPGHDFGPGRKNGIEKALVPEAGIQDHEIHIEFHANRRSPVIPLAQIHSLSHFQRNTKSFIKLLRKSGKPAVLTVNGRAELVVQDAASYQDLLDRLDRFEMIEGVRQGLESMKQGKGRPAKEVFEEVRRKLKLRPGSWSTPSS